MDLHDTINRYYDAVNAGDWEGWLALFDENILMDEQLAGRVEGIARLRELVGGLNTAYSRFQNQPRFIVLVDRVRACVVSHISAVSASGVPIEAEVANVFCIEGGRITYMANFHDRAPFAPILPPQQG